MHENIKRRQKYENNKIKFSKGQKWMSINIRIFFFPEPFSFGIQKFKSNISTLIQSAI